MSGKVWYWNSKHYEINFLLKSGGIWSQVVDAARLGAKEGISVWGPEQGVCYSSVSLEHQISQFLLPWHKHGVSFQSEAFTYCQLLLPGLQMEVTRTASFLGLWTQENLTVSRHFASFLSFSLRFKRRKGTQVVPLSAEEMSPPCLCLLSSSLGIVFLALITHNVQTCTPSLL